MSIQSEITRISGNVADALDAIEEKGVTIPAGSSSDDLADLIARIVVGQTLPDGDNIGYGGAPPIVGQAIVGTTKL